MAKINWSRVVLGGVLWVVVFNVLWIAAWFLFLRSEWMSVYAALGHPWPQGIETLALWLLLTFVGGVLTIWAYAAIRPQYGPGPQTAAGVGVVLWVLSGLGPTVWNAYLLQMPTGPVASALAAALVADVVATILGAWPYKQE